MKPEVNKRIEQIALDFVSQQSVVDTPDEVKMADKVYKTISEIDYWKKNPDKLRFVPVKGDLLGRKIVVAELNGEKAPSDKTVVMIGHFDTVGISDYGANAQYSTQPEILIKKLAELRLSPEVREDLESGKYMFGRGLFDMKSGDAIIIAIMEEISKDIESFEGNIIYAAVYNKSQKRFKLFTPGTLLSTGLFILATVGFNIYISNFSRYNALYGSIGTLIVFLMWLWILAIVILTGNELNNSIYHLSVRESAHVRAADSSNGVVHEDRSKKNVDTFDNTKNKG